MDIVAGVTGAIAVAKQLVELKSVAKDASAKLLVAELQIQLAEVKTRLAEIIQENNQLKESLRKAEAVTPEVVIRGRLYYKPDGDGPFCTNCFDNSGKLIRVVEQPKFLREHGHWRCGTCTTKYGDSPAS